MQKMKASPDYLLNSDDIVLSKYGKFAAWKSLDDRSEIHVLDVKNREKHAVGDSGGKDPNLVYFPWLIGEHEGTHYLTRNDYWSAAEHDMLLASNNHAPSPSKKE